MYLIRNNKNILSSCYVWCFPTLTTNSLIFLDTNWCSTIQFGHQLPRVSVRLHKLRAQSHYTAPIQTPFASPRLSWILLLFIWGSHIILPRFNNLLNWLMELRKISQKQPNGRCTGVWSFHDLSGCFTLPAPQYVYWIGDWWWNSMSSSSSFFSSPWRLR